MPPVGLMIKPASGRCNLRCRYCFYRDEANHRKEADYGIMSESPLDRLLQRVFDYAEGEVSVVFQGGEPTLAGLPFYENYLRLVKQYNRKNLPVYNSIQTNGVLIDENWVELFRRGRFLVGLSLDGPLVVHDRLRPDAFGKGTAKQVLHAAQMLKKAGVDVNILCVVTATNADNAKRLYNFYKKQGFGYLQFIPCIESFDGDGGKDYALTAEEYGKFLTDLFHCWYEDAIKGSPLYIRYFDNLMQVIAGRVPEYCGMRGGCANQYVCEADGGIYPCDFYVLDEYRLGSILTDSLQDCDRKRKEITFVEQSRRLPEDCLACPYFRLCRSGCMRERKHGKSRYCEGYKAFFRTAAPALQTLLAQLMKRRERQNLDTVWHQR